MPAVGTAHDVLPPRAEEIHILHRAHVAVSHVCCLGQYMNHARTTVAFPAATTTFAAVAAVAAVASASRVSVRDATTRPSAD